MSSPYVYCPYPYCGKGFSLSDVDTSCLEKYHVWHWSYYEAHACRCPHCGAKVTLDIRYDLVHVDSAQGDWEDGAGEVE